VSENLLMRDVSSFGGLHDLSVAESRPYQLMIEGYCATSPLSLGDQGIAKLFPQEAKRQGEDIRRHALEVKRFYSLLRNRRKA